MLLAGYLPGLLSVVIYMIMIGVRVHLNPKLAPSRLHEEITWGRRLRALKNVWGIAVLFFVLSYVFEYLRNIGKDDKQG